MNKSFWLLSVLLCLLANSGCGLFGKKDAILDTATLGGTDCLNQVGPQLQKYTSGSISQSDWEQTFTCVGNAIGLFKSFVKGSDPNGYTPNDIQVLVSRFLITNKSIHPEFIAAVFGLKASLYGGTKDLLTVGELNQFLSVQDILKKETSNLIPYLAAKAAKPSRENLVALADAIKTMGAAIAVKLNTAANPPISRAALATFFDELGKLQNWVRPVDEWVTFLAEAKVFLINGNNQEIKGAEWPALLQTLAAYGGSLLALQAGLNPDPGQFTGPNEGGETLLAGASRLHDALGMSLGRWNGVVPISFISGVIDLVPVALLGRNAAAKRGGFKDALLPLNSRLLGSGAAGFDFRSIDTVLSVLQKGTHAETLLEEIYQRYYSPTSMVLKSEFAKTTALYALLSDNISDPVAQNELSRIQSLTGDYPGLFPSTGSEMVLTDFSRHSKNNLIKLSWIEILTRVVLQAYGTGPAVGGAPSGTVDDLVHLLADFKTILHAIGIVYLDPAHVTDPDPKYPAYNRDLVGIASKRYREASLMTAVATGANSISVKETGTYLAYLLSTETQTARIHDYMFGNADKNIIGVCPINAQRDPFDQDTISYTCFKQNYFQNRASFWSGMPGLVAYYNTMSGAVQASLQTLTEGAVRRDIADPAINDSDISGFAGINPYVETVVSRFDTSQPGSGILNRNDSLNNALPIFRNEIQGLIPSNFSWVPVDLPKTLLIYLMQKGHSPFKCFTKISNQELLDLAWWDLNWSGASFNADRMTVFGIFASLTPDPSCPK